MSTTELPGSSLLAGRYRLVERLGAGGMAVVWRGFDEVLGRQVAVKVLQPSTSADPSFRRRLRAEAQTAARLSHPRIVHVHDYGEAVTADGVPVPYVVMELVDGESLAAVLARVQRLPWTTAVRITADVAAALAAAHARGIVHRDVTPANVMLTSAGAKVVDFGISSLIGENDIDPDGSLLGTPAYLAPERLEGGVVSSATDVYAVGLLIYRTLVGQLPWDAGTTTALLRAHQYAEPDPLPYVDGLPRVVEALVARCLQKRPEDRPSSADLAQLLGSISAGNPAGVPEYQQETGEDTTILPSQQPYTSDGTGRVYPGPAPVQVGRGVASVQGPPHRDEAASPSPSDSPDAPVRRAPMPRNSRFNGAGRPVAAAFPSGPVGLLVTSTNGPDPATPAKKGRFTPGGRRILVLAGTVIMLALVTYSWSLIAGKQQDRTNAGPTVVPASGKCVVSYTVVDQDPKTNTFSASLVVANRDTVPLANWNLWWIMPGDQVLSNTGHETLLQQDRGVSVTAAGTLAPQQAESLTFTGRFKASNAAPMAFQLNKESCQAYVSAKPGDPLQPVQQLSDGTTRFAPTPITSPKPISSISPTGKSQATSKPPTSPVATSPTGGDPGPTSPSPGGGGPPLPDPGDGVTDGSVGPNSPDTIDPPAN